MWWAPPLRDGPNRPSHLFSNLNGRAAYTQRDSPWRGSTRRGQRKFTSEHYKGGRICFLYFPSFNQQHWSTDWVDQKILQQEIITKNESRVWLLCTVWPDKALANFKKTLSSINPVWSRVLTAHGLNYWQQFVWYVWSCMYEYYACSCNPAFR